MTRRARRTKWPAFPGSSTGRGSVVGTGLPGRSPRGMCPGAAGRSSPAARGRRRRGSALRALSSSDAPRRRARRRGRRRGHPPDRAGQAAGPSRSVDEIEEDELSEVAPGHHAPGKTKGPLPFGSGFQVLRSRASIGDGVAFWKPLGQRAHAASLEEPRTGVVTCADERPRAWGRRLPHSIPRRSRWSAFHRGSPDIRLPRPSSPVA